MFQFVRRHKNKLGFVGIGIAALSGGLYVAQQYIAKNALEAQISETRNLINQSRHHKQFESQSILNVAQALSVAKQNLRIQQPNSR